MQWFKCSLILVTTDYKRFYSLKIVLETNGLLELTKIGFKL
jgi:hypothetical protein